jgi:hypothetical protein
LGKALARPDCRHFDFQKQPEHNQAINRMAGFRILFLNRLFPIRINGHSRLLGKRLVWIQDLLFFLKQIARQFDVVGGHYAQHIGQQAYDNGLAGSGRYVKTKKKDFTDNQGNLYEGIQQAGFVVQVGSQDDDVYDGPGDDIHQKSGHVGIFPLLSSEKKTDQKNLNQQDEYEIECKFHREYVNRAAKIGIERFLKNLIL